MTATVAGPATAGMLEARCGCTGSPIAKGKEIFYLKVRVPCENGHPNLVEPGVILHVAHQDIGEVGSWAKETTPADTPEPKPKARKRTAARKTTTKPAASRAGRTDR